MMDEKLSRSPLCLTVPGLNGSGPDHWQSRWERERNDTERVELGCWSAPIRNVWITRIEQAVSYASWPVILVAHSLGCLAVAWWAHLLGGGATGPVAGALLVASPVVDGTGIDGTLTAFSPAPRTVLPFPTILVASRNDPYASLDRSRAMAGDWGSSFVDVGEAGHINAESGLGSWEEGQALLDALFDAALSDRPIQLPDQSRRTSRLAGGSVSAGTRIQAL